MAKNRTKNDGKYIEIFLIGLAIIAFALFIVSLFIPIIMFVGFIFYMVSYLTNKSACVKRRSPFWLTTKEKEIFRDLYNIRDIGELRKDAAEKIGEIAEIDVNADGSFSRRSKIGKKINAIVEDSEKAIEKSSNKLKLLSIFPFGRWKYLQIRYIRFFSFSGGLIGWVGALVVYVIFIGESKFSGDLIKSIHWIYDPYSVNSSFNSEHIVMIYILAVTSALCFGLFHLIGRFSFKYYWEQPPVVDILNIDMDITNNANVTIGKHG